MPAPARLLAALLAVLLGLLVVRALWRPAPGLVPVPMRGPSTATERLGAAAATAGARASPGRGGAAAPAPRGPPASRVAR